MPPPLEADYSGHIDGPPNPVPREARNYFFEEGFPVSLNNIDNLEFASLKGCKISANASALFTSDNQGNIYAVTSEGKGIFSDSLFNLAQLPVQEKSDLVLGDLDSDGSYDKIIAVTRSGYIAGFDLTDANGDFFADTLFTLSLAEDLLNQPVINGQHFYITTISGRIAQYDFNGNFVAESQVSSINSNIVVPNDLNDVVYNSNSVFGPIVVDLDSDGIRDNIFFPDSSQIEIDFSNGNEQNYITDSKMNGSPVLADMDMDGYYEIIYHSDYLIHGINYNNAQVTNMPFEPVLSENEKLIGSPLVADVDDDGLMDVISMTNQGQVFAYNSNGKLLNGFSVSAGGRITNSPLLIDIDDDNKLELFTMSNNGHINAWQFEDGYITDNLWWTQESFAPDNNILVSRYLSPVTSSINELMPSKKVYNYPNPNIDDFTYIRYFLTDNARVNIKIFDLAGDMVDSFNGPGDSGIDQQVKWDVSDIESGVYLCRVEAKSAGKSNVRIIKIMVIH